MARPVAPPRLYFEDVETGDDVETPGLTVTEAHVGLYQGVAGEPVEDPTRVPDLLPLALATGLGWRTAAPPLVVLAFMGIDWQVQAAMRVGDTMKSRARIVATRPMREGGVVVEEREIIDQRGQVVQRGRFTYLVARRPKETSP